MKNTVPQGSWDYVPPLNIISLDDIPNLMFDSVIPACCNAGCMVEEDGTCPHGHGSVLSELAIL